MQNIFGPIAYAFVALIVMFATRVITRRAKNYKSVELDDEQNKPQCFKAAFWVYGMYSSGLLIVAVSSYSAIYIFRISGMGAGFELAVIIGIVSLLGTIYGIVITSRMYVKLDEETYTYFDGRKIEAQGTYRSIRAITVSSGKIVIDSGKGYREYIPMYFKKSGLLIAMLEQRRKQHLS